VYSQELNCPQSPAKNRAQQSAKVAAVAVDTTKERIRRTQSYCVASNYHGEELFMLSKLPLTVPTNTSKITMVSLVLAATQLVSCMPKSVDPQNSGIKTTDVAHTNVKWQSIGNCWLYAMMGWSESLAMVNGKQADFSESYLTYLYFEEQLLSTPSIKEIQTGGWWDTGADLMLKHGLMLEGDFIPQEQALTCSVAQGKAVKVINAALASGAIRSDPSPAKIRKLMDSAFGVNMESLKSKVINASNIRLASVNGSTPAPTLRDELLRWSGEYWSNSNLYSVTQRDAPFGPIALTQKNKQVLTKVMRALNDHKPVVMSWFVDFNAAVNGTFSIEALIKAGKAGSQGGHMTVVEDYVAHGVDPQTGKPFQTTEGENSPELKRLAAEFGTIDYFVVKNSWGGADRPSRPSYTHDNEQGFTRLNASYIFGAVPRTESNNLLQLTLNEFILPKGN
jgi:hypothetical protein